MRKLAASLFVSLDGVTEAPNTWQFDAFDDDMGAAMGAAIGETDTALLGRVTYQDWAPYWPSSSDEPFASFINHVPKVVVSHTLTDVAWGTFDSVSLLRGDLRVGITALKAQTGKTISVMGSPTLVRSLLQAHLLDELTVMLHPVVAGRGKRLFVEGLDVTRLELTRSQITGSGVALLTYRPRSA